MKDEKPSSTALAVCAGVCAFGLTHRRLELVDDETLVLSNKALRFASPSLFFFVTLWDRLKILDAVRRFFEWLTVRGVCEHFALRKKTIEGMVIAEIQECEQLLILGGGYDFLPLKMACRFPSLKVFETDHPATQQVKKKIYSTVKVPANLYLVPIDYTKTTLLDALSKVSSFRTGVKTCVVVEGVLMYLTLEQVTGVFDTLDKLCGPHSPIVMTMMERNENEPKIRFQTQSRLLDLWMDSRGEPFLCGMAKEELVRFANSKNRVLAKYEDDESVRAKLNPSGRPAKGEVIALLK